jgi:hypothetical protein
MAEGQYPKDLEDKINNIVIYQIGISDISLVLNKKVELVNTGTPSKYLEASTKRELRIKAYHLGADAIVNFDYKPDKGAFGGFRSTSYILYGTPVKFID